MNEKKIEVEDTLWSKHNEMNYYEPTVIIKEESKLRRFLLSPLTIGVGVFLISISFSYNYLIKKLEEENNRKVQSQLSSMKSEVTKYEKLLRNVSLYLEKNGDISPNEFIKYTESFDIKNDYPALIRIDYINLLKNDENFLFYNNLRLDYENLNYYLENQSKILEMIEKNKVINEKKNIISSSNDKRIFIKYTYPMIENIGLIGEEYYYIDKETFEKTDYNAIFSSYIFRGLLGNPNSPKTYKTNLIKKIRNSKDSAVSLTVNFSKELFGKTGATAATDKCMDVKIFSSDKDGKRLVYETYNKEKNPYFTKNTNLTIGSDIYDVQFTSAKSIFYERDYIQLLLLSIAFSLTAFLAMRKLEKEKKKNVVLDSQAIENIESQLRTDDLTKLSNRRACQQDLKDLLKQHKLRRSMDSDLDVLPSLYLVFIDLDGFKRINDTLGHSYGDTVLIEYGIRLKKLLGNIEGISFYRLGGDEFTVIIDRVDGQEQDEIKTIVENISNLTKEPFILRNENYYVTQSIGVASYPNNAKNTETLLKNADIAMYEAKKSGKNCFVFFDKKISEAVNKKNKVINNINEALEKDEFHMMYQPKFKYISEGKYVCSGVEALVRWENEKLGNVRPDLFIPVIEEHGLINEVTHWILNKICQECQQLKNIQGFKVSINLSAKQLSNLDLAKQFSKTIARYGLKNEMFVIEITETTMMKDADITRVSLNNFNDLGFSISVDDFGTGYSSLSYLKSFPVDELKIDKSFTDMVLLDKHTQVIVEGIINMCEKLKINIVVEGVEALEQIKWFESQLIENQTIEIQGYYFSKPLVIKDLINFCFKKKSE